MEGLLARLVNGFPGMAYRCLHDSDWTLEFASEGSSDLLGYSPDDLVTDRVVAVSELIHPDDLARVSLEVEKALSNKAPFACVYRMRTKDGSLKWISEVGRGVFDLTGNLEAIEGFLSDITTEVEAREASQLAERRAVVARMASGIAHDFNNVLTGILGAVGQARFHASSGEAEPELASIETLVDRAAGLTRQLLAFGQSRSIRTDPIDLRRVLQDLDTVLSSVIGCDVKVDLRIPDEPLAVQIDPVQFEQVVINLAVNARDAMPQGGDVVIALERDTQGSTARLSVADSGSGIEPGLIDRLFEPYFTTKDPGQGTGLGLATVRSVAEGVGGTVRVTSDSDGSTFEVALPLSTPGSVGDSSQPYGSEVILLADDDEAVRSSLSQGLRRLGYTILEAADGEQALMISGRHKGPIDLLITDGRMPKLDGLGLAQRFIVERPGTPAMLLTGDNATGPAGFFAVELSKPMSASRLAEHARKVLGTRATS